MSIKGYKAFNEDWTCNDFKYEVGKTYKHEGEIEVCKEGFHFCEKLSSCFSYYEFDPNNKVAEVEALGIVETEGSKSVTDEIKIVKELNWNEVLNIVNLGDENSGMNNSGDNNTGDNNSGNWNSGNWNSGNCNAGNYNRGNCNAGNSNTGNWDVGYLNAGNRNTGNYNRGDYNTGDYNTKNYNVGNFNSGSWNTGNCNKGNWNSGNRNVGDFNKGNWNVGAFNTITPNIYLFNKSTEWSIKDWENSDAKDILDSKSELVKWIYVGDMTEEEKEENPDYKYLGGYLKVFNYEEMCKNMWNNLTDEEKEIIKALPNFDEDIFEEITGIRL